MARLHLHSPNARLGAENFPHWPRTDYGPALQVAPDYKTILAYFPLKSSGFYDISIAVELDKALFLASILI